MCSKEKVFRPSLDDVERISLGKGARKRGTGSRYVPHRLNQDERRLFTLAKTNSYLIVKGTAYRRRRKGSPVCNTFRQRCDALEQICIIIEKYGCHGDRIKIDFSTLRVRDDRAQVSQIWNLLLQKYPEMMEDAKECCKDAAIDWESTKNNPIWNVTERLVVIDSVHDRALAKALVEDILKESLEFSENDVRHNQFEFQYIESGCDVKPGSGASNDLQENANEADDEIDWNDI